MRNTSRSRQLAWSWTPRQSLANRSSRTGCGATARNRQISAVSAGWALPPKTAMSRTPGFFADLAAGFLAGRRGLKLERRQAELVPDVLLGLLRRRSRVHRDDVLLAPEQVQHRVGLLVVVPQPYRQRLFGVVFPGDQFAAAGVAPPGHLGGAVDQVVVEAAARAQPPGKHPAADLAVRQFQRDDPVDVVALQEELGLPPVPRKAVDDEAVVPVVIGQPAADHRLDQVVPDQLPRGHDPPDLGAHLGVVLHVPAEDVAHGDVHEVEVGGQQLALRAFSAALHAHDHVLAHGISLAYAASTWHTQAELPLAGPPHLAADQHAQLRPVVA